jgi:hypothetical protein
VGEGKVASGMIVAVGKSKCSGEEKGRAVATFTGTAKVEMDGKS